MGTLFESNINNVNDISNELHNISRIEFGDYFNTAAKRPQSANILTSITRTFYYRNQNRHMTLEYINILVDKTLLLINEMTKTKDQYQSHISTLCIKLLNSRTGIINLCGIYYDDEHIKSGLQKIINKINMRYDELMSHIGSDTYT